MENNIPTICIHFPVDICEWRAAWFLILLNVVVLHKQQQSPAHKHTELNFIPFIYVWHTMHGPSTNDTEIDANTSNILYISLPSSLSLSLSIPLPNPFIVGEYVLLHVTLWRLTNVLIL